MFEKIDHKLLSHRKSIASCAILLDIDHHHNLLKDKVHPSMFNTLTSTPHQSWGLRWQWRNINGNHLSPLQTGQSNYEGPAALLTRAGDKHSRSFNRPYEGGSSPCWSSFTLYIINTLYFMDGLISMSSTQFHVYLPWVKPFEHSILIYLFFILKCKNTGKHFQLGKGPSRGLLCLCDCENFAKLFFQLYCWLLTITRPH